MQRMLLRLLYHLIRRLRPRLRAASPCFLILQYRVPLGCCVHATPLYAALKVAHPGCTIIVATRGVGYALLRHDPNVDHLLDTPDPGASLREIARHAGLLRARLRALDLRPTHVLQDATSRRGTLAFFALLLRLAPTKGFADRRELYDAHLAYDPTRSLIDNNLRLVGDATPHTEPAVYFTATDMAAARALLLEANPSASPVTAVVVQGSGGQPNNWHDDRFAELIQHVESVGHSVVLLGTVAEAPAIERIRALARSRGHSLAGRTTLPQLAALLCLCDALITVDTGTLHVGRAAQAPTLVLAPSWQPAIEWLPLAVPNAAVLRGEDSAPPPAGYRLDEITPDAAIAAFTQLVRRFPPASATRQRRLARLLSTTRGESYP